MFDKLMLNNFERLTDTDNHILKFFIENKDIVHNMTLEELSQKVNYSKTTIHRCIKKLGFSGFSEFKFTLKSSFNQSKPEFYDTKSIQKKMLFEIESTIKSVDEERMHELFKILKSSHRVYGYGTGWKQEIALRLFLNDLPSFGIYPSELRSVPDFEIALKTVTKNDLVIIISLSGETNDIKHIVKQLFIQDIPTLTLTEGKINYLAQHSTFAFSYLSTPEQNITFSKPWSSLTIHALLEYILHAYQQYLQTTN